MTAAAPDSARPAVAGWRARLAIFLLASLSIASLLLYFAGIGRFGRLAPALLGIETAGLLLVTALGNRREALPSRDARIGVAPLIASGLWAGSVATIAYDLVRVPLVHAHLPVFKAISYFGMVLLGVDRPSLASEILGWGYHLTNGASFGLMYAALAVRPRAVTAILWGLSLEGLMLLTPYAEIFGYARDARFVAITLTSHAVYGAALWFALRHYPSIPPVRRIAVMLGVPVALALMAADFHSLHGRSLTGAPPSYVGPHLYTCWNSPEPDRVALLWILKRFGDPAAELHFIEPFDKIRFGTPLDVPEAMVRRQGTRSATEVLVADTAVPSSPRLALLVRTTHLAEITPWMMIADQEASGVADELRRAAAESCGDRLRADCLPSLLSRIDRWYGAPTR